MNAVSGYSNSINNLDNVQNEVLFKKKMMLIERPKHYSDFVFILALGIIILLAGLASSFSPYTCLQFSSSRPLHNKKPHQRTGGGHPSKDETVFQTSHVRVKRSAT